MASLSSILGSRVPRIDGYEKVTGRARYTADLRLPRMLYGRIVTSMVPHGRVLRIDVSRASAYTGVVDVVTCKDVKVRWVAGDRYRSRYVLPEEPRFAGLLRNGPDRGASMRRVPGHAA